MGSEMCIRDSHTHSVDGFINLIVYLFFDIIVDAFECIDFCLEFFNSDSYLPMGLGERFDIYVGDDSTAQYELQNELSTGMTVSEMRKVSKLEHDIMMLKFEGRQRKRNKECMS